MKILVSSHLFHPSVGGVEEVGLALARAWVAAGHDVTVVTQTESDDRPGYSFKIFRRPSLFKLLVLVVKCDVFFHNNISLQTAWPLVLVKRPWIIVHHTWIARPDGSLGWRDHLKKFLLRFATNISVSRAIADKLPLQSTVINNPYRDDLFKRYAGQRAKELIFLGRLVSDKGVDILIEALALLRKADLRPSLTIVGSGIELGALRALTVKRGLSDQIDFAGTKIEKELVEVLNQHQILVVPSRWQEPFGLVALEGIACGCVIVGSSGGGLMEAIGPCGLVFDNGDTVGLTAILRDLLTHPESLLRFRANAAQHLQAHCSRSVASTYLALFQKVRECNSR